MPNPQNIEKHKWKKGQSGNPKGRPKRIPDLGNALAQTLGEVNDERTALDIILLKLRSDAMKGNIRAAELLLKYAFPNGIGTHTDTEIELVWGKLQTKESNETED
jgi:hypothetical protein